MDDVTRHERKLARWLMSGYKRKLIDLRERAQLILLRGGPSSTKGGWEARQVVRSMETVAMLMECRAVAAENPSITAG